MSTHVMKLPSAELEGLQQTLDILLERYKHRHVYYRFISMDKYFPICADI